MEPIKSTEETVAESGQNSHRKSLKEADKKLVPASLPEGGQITRATDEASGVTECPGSNKFDCTPRGVEEDGSNKDTNPCQSSNCDNGGEKLSTIPLNKEQFIGALVQEFFKNYTYHHIHSQYTDYKKYGTETNTIKNQNVDNSICTEFLEESGETDHKYLPLSFHEDIDSYDHEIHVYPCSTSDRNEASNTREDTHDTSDATDLNDNVISLNEHRHTNNVNLPVDPPQNRGEIIDLSQQNRLSFITHDTSDATDLNDNVISLNEHRHTNNVNVPVDTRQLRGAIVDLSQQNRLLSMVDLRAARRRNNTNIGLGPRVCLLCASPYAQVWCGICDHYFCPLCDQQHHSTMGRQGHQRSYM